VRERIGACELPARLLPPLALLRRVLAHGYALNHTALSVHRMPGMQGGIGQLVHLLQALGHRLNSDGRCGCGGGGSAWC
jgi:hypothetical protein